MRFSSCRPGLMLACLGAVGEWGDAVLIIDVPACFLLSYGCVAWTPCGVPHLAHHRLLLVPGAMSRRWMYIMNMMYAMYIKDIKIQRYKNTMNIWGDADGMIAMPYATPGDETWANKTR